jgi:hypothetical protein
MQPVYTSVLVLTWIKGHQGFATVSSNSVLPMCRHWILRTFTHIQNFVASGAQFS